MVIRLFNNDGTAPLPGITDFDLIIVDEAHRGYILDREMGEDELLYRDQADYQSQYRRVLDYFDAVKIGLTATPALHTTQIFGAPVFWYTYPEAVDEDWLVDHDTPHQMGTRLTEEGIHYKAGDTVTVLDPAARDPVTGEIAHSELLADDLDFDVDDFNRRVINENTDRAILEEIAPDLHPEAPEVYGKTLIFAVNDAHADRIVDILRNIYKDREKYPDLKLPSRAILKITAAAGGGDRERTLNLIREFKNENHVSIAVTVDLLSTGVDVPEITRLVFMRRVKSRILFEQMMGRATRKCDKLHKDHFDVYDPVGTCESFEPLSDMRPVAVNPKTEFPELCNGLALAEGEDTVRAQIRQVLARLQRRAKRADADTLAQFAARMDGQTPEQFAAAVRELPAEEARTVLLTRQKALELLDKPFHHPRPVVLANEPDEVIYNQQTYGDYNSPEDYLAAFENYLRENRDEIASLRILRTRPAELTRASLIQLRQALRDCDFTKTQLNSALSRVTNQEIAADIVSLIRRYALGSTLKSHEERIHGAVEKLKAAHAFNKVELDWIQRLEDYLMNEDVLTVSMFDEDPRYRAQGGFARFNKLFRGQLAQIVEELNVYLFDDGGESA